VTDPADAPCICTELSRVTERAALAAARFLGSGDPEDAGQAGAKGARRELDELAIDGRIVVGWPEGSPVAEGSTVGRGGAVYELAVDPVQGQAVVARGASGAISIVAAAAPRSMRPVPPLYMRKLAVGQVAAGRIDLSAAVADTIDAVAEAYARRPGDLTAIVLDRPRHEDLIEDIRAAGARIKLIADGDITASISASIRGTNDHLAMGIGGAREAVITAAALRCLGGEVQAQFWPRSRTDIRQIEEYGFEDVQGIVRTEDLVRGDAIVVATGISNGDLLRGVRYVEEGGRTHSIVLCSRCNHVRFLDTTHRFTRDRRAAEVRL
jgi:fructose-1,6-bisphosphatase II